MRTLHPPLDVTTAELVALVRPHECPHCFAVSQLEPGDPCKAWRYPNSQAYEVAYACPHCKGWFFREWLSETIWLSDVLRARKGLPPSEVNRRPLKPREATA